MQQFSNKQMIHFGKKISNVHTSSHSTENMMTYLFHFQIAQLDRQKQEYGTQLEEVRFD